MHWNEFKVRATAQDLRHHGFVFHRVNAAGGVHQVATGDQKGSPSHGDFNLHLEHPTAFFGCPVPPNISVFARRSRARARHIRHHRIKARGRQASEVPTVVLRDHDVGQPQPASIAHQHVEASRDGFVGHHNTVWMKRFSQLRCL